MMRRDDDDMMMMMMMVMMMMMMIMMMTMMMMTTMMMMLTMMMMMMMTMMMVMRKQYPGIKDLFFCKGSTAQKTRSVCETASPAPSATTRLHKQLQAEKHRRQIHAGAQGLHSGTQCNTLFLC